MRSTLAHPDDAALDRLLEAIFRAYRHDFRRYARTSMRRRVARALAALGQPTIDRLRERVVDDPRVFARLLRFLTIQVSDFFRDPGYWRALRERVAPHLGTYPFLRVWVAGCGAGEEAYSLAILLHEEGLLERTQIYATDIAVAGLEAAAAGAYALERVRGFSDNYFRAGGKASLSDYYTTGESHAAFAPWLRRRILFSDHSLATDAVFAEVQLVSCRNVLIYFERALQDRAVEVFLGALCPRGFLGLGAREALTGSAHLARFEAFAPEHNIHRRRTQHEHHR